MNKKKIFMSLLLVLVIIGIVIAIINTNKKANEKLEKIAKSDVDVDITDNYFIEATNDVYINMKEYAGKTIRMEGLMYYYDDLDGKVRHAVIRNTPGCCGSDGLAGLDISMDEAYPLVDTWVQVIGKIEIEKISGYDTTVIKVSDIVEKEAGETFVTN